MKTKSPIDLADLTVGAYIHRATSGAERGAVTYLYIGRRECWDSLSVAVTDPRDAASGDVVGWAHGVPVRDTDVYDPLISDGERLVVDGVPCTVGTHEYEDDGSLAYARITRD